MTIYDFAKISQSLCYLFYQYHHILDRLLLSARLVTNQILIKLLVVDYKMSIGKLLFRT